jgi:ribosomal protein S18 acetylase RimI-like enzyme
MIEIRPIRKTDSPKAFLDFICELIDEDTYLLIKEKPTIKEERVWVKGRLQGIQNKKEAMLTAWDGKKLVAICDGKRAFGKEENNIVMGIVILKEYRGRGLGEKLLRRVIRLVKQRLKPKNIYLHVFAENKIAKSLYRKIGFVHLATFPKWIRHKGAYHDAEYMVLK